MIGYGRGTGWLARLRGGGSLARALLFALLLQIAAPIVGLVPGAAALPPADAITVCTGHGIVTFIPDGQGGWTEQKQADESGLSCAFCLPLLSGHAAPTADLALPQPLPDEEPRPTVALAAPIPATPPGSFSPRAPPAV